MDASSLLRIDTILFSTAVFFVFKRERNFKNRLAIATKPLFRRMTMTYLVQFLRLLVLECNRQNVRIASAQNSNCFDFSGKASTSADIWLPSPRSLLAHAAPLGFLMLSRKTKLGRRRALCNSAFGPSGI